MSIKKTPNDKEIIPFSLLKFFFFILVQILVVKCHIKYGLLWGSVATILAFLFNLLIVALTEFKDNSQMGWGHHLMLFIPLQWTTGITFSIKEFPGWGIFSITIYPIAHFLSISLTILLLAVVALILALPVIVILVILRIIIEPFTGPLPFFDKILGENDPFESTEQLEYCTKKYPSSTKDTIEILKHARNLIKNEKETKNLLPVLLRHLEDSLNAEKQWPTASTNKEALILHMNSFCQKYKPELRNETQFVLDFIEENL